MADFKEAKDNPLHIEYGVLSNTKYILKKMVQYDKVVLFIAIIGVICGSSLSYLWSILNKYIVDIVTSGNNAEECIRELLFVILIFAGIAFVLTAGNCYDYSKSFYRYIAIRMKMILERIDRALHMNYEKLERPEVLDIHERASQATGGNNNGVEGMMHLMATMAKNLVTVIVTFVAVLVVDWRLILVMTAVCVAQWLYFIRIVKKDKVEVWDKLAPTWRQASYMQRVTQDFDFAKDIRLFDMSRYLIKKQREFYNEREKKVDYHLKLWMGHAWFVNATFLISYALMYYVIVQAVLDKGMSIGNATMYLSFSMAFSSNLLNFLQRLGDYKRASLEVDDFRSFLALSVDDAKIEKTIPESDSYTIEFHDVSYRYEKADRDAVSHLNMTIHPGERLAVVGLNGAGKTTMIKLLLRLYDPTEGYISLNGTDIRSFDREEYYQLFSPVFQDVEIFAFPVAENVSMNVPEKTDKDKARKALDEAGLLDKIIALPKDVDTELLKIVDDNGVDMSGGEKQKLALARALYKGAPVVVLDEPTSALDAIAEQQLYERFDKMIGRKSAVYISHRLASTRFCDNVAMFKDGQMIEYGTHDELMDKDGEYAKMFNVQAQYYQDEKGGEQ